MGARAPSSKLVTTSNWLVWNSASLPSFVCHLTGRLALVCSAAQLVHRLGQGSGADGLLRSMTTSGMPFTSNTVRR